MSICTFCEEEKDDNSTSSDGRTHACGDCRGMAD